VITERSSVSEIDRMLEANADWAQGRTEGAQAAPPTRQVAVVTCMDARIDPLAALGLRPGEAHVIRNAGGVVTDDVLRSLAVSQHALGTREVLVLHHSRCGMEGLDEAGFLDGVEQATGARPAQDVRGFADVDDDVRAAVRTLRESAYLVSTDVRGAVYDVETGAVRTVD
jgi:carbonic anhydrase